MLKEDWEADNENQLRIKMHKFFAEECANVASYRKDKTNPQTQTDQRASNVHVGHAMDNALQQGIGMSLALFEMQNELRPLRRSELRYMADVESNLSRTTTLRSCI